MQFDEQQVQGLNFALPEPTPIVARPSLSEQKLATLAKNKAAKVAKIAPDTVDQSLDDMFESLYGGDPTTGAPESDYIDQAQAGLYKLGRDTARLGTDVAGWGAEQLGFDQQAEQLRNVDYRTDDEINQHVGFDPRQHNQNIQQVSSKYDALGDAWDKGGVTNIAGAGLDLFTSGAKAVPGLVADSAAIIGSMVIPGVGQANLLSKLGLQAAKLGSKSVPAMLKSLDKVVRVNPTTIAIGAGMANEQRREYEEATGEEASWARIAGSSAANIGLMGLEFNIFKNMAKSIPADMANDLTQGTAKALASGGVKGLAKNVGVNASKIAGAAGAEAAQEYLQTWTQILTEQPGDLKGLLLDKANIKEANIAGLLGGTTAGSIRATPLAATGAVNLGARGVSKAGKTVAKKVADVSADASYKILPKEDRQAIQDKYEAEDKLHQTFTTQLEKQTTKLEDITTKDQLDRFMEDSDNQTDGKIHTAINSLKTSLDKFGDTKLTDRMVTSAVRKAISANNDAIVKSKALLESARAGDATYRVYERAKKGAKKALDSKALKDVVEVAKDTYKVTKDFTGKAIDSTTKTVKNLDTSAARGFIDDVAEGRATNSLKNKEIDKKLKAVINEITDNDLDTMIEVAHNSPYVKKLLQKTKEARFSARESLGIVSNKVLTALPEESTIQKVKASANMTKTQALALYNELQTIAGRQVVDPEVKQQLDNALTVLNRSKNITAKQYKVLERKVRRGYKNQTITEDIKKGTDTVVKKTKAYYKTLKPHIEEFTTKAKEYIKEEGVDTKNIGQVLKKGGDLTKGETKVMVSRVAGALLLREGDVSQLGVLDKKFYEQYQKLVDDKIEAKNKPAQYIQQIKDILDPKQSSPKHEEDTIQDQEDKVEQNFKSEKVISEEINDDFNAFLEETHDILCK